MELFTKNNLASNPILLMRGFETYFLLKNFNQSNKTKNLNPGSSQNYQIKLEEHQGEPSIVFFKKHSAQVELLFQSSFSLISFPLIPVCFEIGNQQKKILIKNYFKNNQIKNYDYLINNWFTFYKASLIHIQFINFLKLKRIHRIYLFLKYYNVYSFVFGVVQTAVVVAGDEQNRIRGKYHLAVLGIALFHLTIILLKIAFTCILVYFYLAH